MQKNREGAANRAPLAPAGQQQSKAATGCRRSLISPSFSSTPAPCPVQCRPRVWGVWARASASTGLLPGLPRAHSVAAAGRKESSSECVRIPGAFRCQDSGRPYHVRLDRSTPGTDSIPIDVPMSARPRPRPNPNPRPARGAELL